MSQSHRKAIIAGNWKMNQTIAQTRAFIEQLKPLVTNATRDIIICTPFTDLQTAVECTKNSNIKVGAQNCHFEKSGAYTGEISAEMLTEIGVEYVIIGHSERRRYFGETNDTVNKRLRAALAAGLKVIVCIGELLEHRQTGITNEICTIETKTALYQVEKEQMKNIVFAYEPIWAVGTGTPVAPEQANEVGETIRKAVAELYDLQTAQQLRILYGGSMNLSNAEAFLRTENIDGGLLGGAALNCEEFAQIING